MSDLKLAFASSVAMTITGPTTTGTARESTAVDNSSNLYLDAWVLVGFLKNGNAPGPLEVIIYVYGSEDGSVYEDPCTGTDAAITLEANPVTRIVRRVPVKATLTVGYETVFSVAQAFGGVMPRKWGIIVENQSGNAALSGCSASYTGVYATVN